MRPFCFAVSREQGAKKRRFRRNDALRILNCKNELLTLRCTAEEQCDVHA